MNYIQGLQQSIKEKDAIAGEVIQEIDNFISFLQSSKFQGVDSRDGSANDWIRASEVIERIREMRSRLEHGKKLTQ